jgi:TctA family transporter
MCLVGVLLGQIGTDVNSGLQRFTMDLPFLADGVGLVSVALGCFGIAEITKNLDSREERSPFSGKINLIPTWPEFKRIIPSALRGSVVGSALGILPGGGPTIAQFCAYAIDKKVSKYRHEIGQGCIEGVAGQAAADEAAARTSFIPLMSIGIPENAVMALMMAAFIIKGIQPGPNMIAGHPDLFWGLVASMWVGNCFLIILNVPLVRYWLSVFKIPYAVLFPSILFFCCIGTFSVNNNLDDIFITATFGVLGYLFMRLDLDPAPLMLGFILGPMLEENFRRAMLLSRGSFGMFVTRPISGTLIGLIALFVAWQLISFVLTARRNRGETPAAQAA